MQGFDSEFVFAAEDNDAPSVDNARPLIVLSVDDDSAFQQSLRMALSSYRFHDQRVQLLTAGSATEAARILAETPEIALVLLDVVMETDDAGLRLVRSVREVLGNAEVRIVLVTGQPGMAPMKQTLERLDISDYWLKTELHRERLHGILTASLRTWQEIRALARAKRGLQLVVEASNSLARTKNLRDFSQRVIHEMSRLLGVAPDGLVCVQADADSPLAARLIGVAGRFAPLAMQSLRHIDDARIRDMLLDALENRSAVEAECSQVLFFEGAEHVPPVAVYLATARTLDETERELLRVFATNANTGLINVALASRLDQMAYEDALLAIPNANALQRALDSVLEIAGPRDRALLLFELEQYAQSSLALGIEQGALLLRRMADRLRQVFPPPCLVARMHEGIFAVLGPAAMLTDARVQRVEDEDATGAAPLIGIVAARLDLDGYEGSPRRAMASGLLLLKRARQSGAGRMLEYTREHERESQQSLLLSHRLHQALQAGGIHIVLQAQFELASGRIVGAEVLARWHDAGEDIPPARFIPVAEATGMIVPLGRQVIEHACRALARLDAEGFPDLPVAVNVSPLQLQRREFADELMAAVARHGVRPQRLELEITESVVMEDLQANREVLGRLRQAGFPIAVDDFGTGYSSLRYVHWLPITTLKLDRSFIEQIGRIEDQRSSADMIITLGRRLGLRVLAEGVETAEQADWLASRRCHSAQGYHFARPEPLDALIRRLRG